MLPTQPSPCNVVQSHFQNLEKVPEFVNQLKHTPLMWPYIVGIFEVSYLFMALIKFFINPIFTSKGGNKILLASTNGGCLMFIFPCTSDGGSGCSLLA